MFAIVTHPAFRIGFLDAQAGHVLDHDNIIARIEGETPESALRRIGWGNLLSADDIGLAQYRYEEGRLTVISEGLRCKAWGHPDNPPSQVMSYIIERAAGFQRAAKPEPADG